MEVEIQKSLITPFILHNEPVKNLYKIILNLDCQTYTDSIEVFASDHLLFDENTKKWEERIRLDKQLLEYSHQWYIHPQHTPSHRFKRTVTKLKIHVITNSIDTMSNGQRTTFTVDYLCDCFQYSPKISVFDCWANILPILPNDEENNEEEIPVTENILDHVYDSYSNYSNDISPRTLDMLENGEIERPVLTRSTNQSIIEY